VRQRAEVFFEKAAYLSRPLWNAAVLVCRPTGMPPLGLLPYWNAALLRPGRSPGPYLLVDNGRVHGKRNTISSSKEVISYANVIGFGIGVLGCRNRTRRVERVDLLQELKSAKLVVRAKVVSYETEGLKCMIKDGTPEERTFKYSTDPTWNPSRLVKKRAHHMERLNGRPWDLK